MAISALDENFWDENFDTDHENLNYTCYVTEETKNLLPHFVPIGTPLKVQKMKYEKGYFVDLIYTDSNDDGKIKTITISFNDLAKLPKERRKGPDTDMKWDRAVHIISSYSRNRLGVRKNDPQEILDLLKVKARKTLGLPPLSPSK
jgi:hypothetical protein